MAAFAERHEAPDCPFAIRMFTHQVEITVAPEQQHYWSPHLNLLVWESDAGARLEGRFGPSPRVWTMFMAMYGATIITAFVGATFGFSQVILGLSPWGIYLAVGMVLAVIAIYVGAQMGQRLGEDQMRELHGFVTNTVGAQETAAVEAARSSDAPAPTRAASAI